jgi:hypothetical protein
MYAPTLEHMTDTVQDVAHKVADRAPDIASQVGRSARSTAETVSDAVVKLAQKTPFLDAPKPQHHRGRWMLRAAIIATIAGVAMWIANRRRASLPWYRADETPADDETASTTQRRYATAGH